MLGTFSISEYSSSKLVILQIEKLRLKKIKICIQSYKMVAEHDPALKTSQDVHVTLGQLQGHLSAFITTASTCGPGSAQQKPESF